MKERQEWLAWPICSRCGRRRQTVCPMCGSAGTAFPLAEYQAAGMPQRNSRQSASEDSGNRAVVPSEVLLICTDCDEAFPARFYRVCPRCGEDAGEGVKIPSLVSEARQFTPRLSLAIYGLFAILVAALLYFWLLFRNA